MDKPVVIDPTGFVKLVDEIEAYKDRADAEIARLRLVVQHESDCVEAAKGEIERLRDALGLLRIAVDREGWPAGWGQIRAKVSAALNQPPQAKKPPQDMRDFVKAIADVNG